nr:hypothetical protein GCM10020241_10740 [Streptoalloteichus tenebrarius]
MVTVITEARCPSAGSTCPTVTFGGHGGGEVGAGSAEDPLSHAVSAVATTVDIAANTATCAARRSGVRARWPW